MQNENLNEDEFNNTEPTIKNTPRKKDGGIWETVKFIIIAFAIVWPIRAFVAQPFIVSGSSMVPTFQNSQYLIVDQLTYRLENPERGDVVIFKYPNDTSKFFIKRVIGLPRETVVIEGSDVYIKDENGDEIKIDEPYVMNEGRNFMEAKLGEHEYFVMGDNREASSDSRSWGNLDEKFIIGRALVRLLPFNTFSVKPGDYKYNETK